MGDSSPSATIATAATNSICSEYEDCVLPKMVPTEVDSTATADATATETATETETASPTEPPANGAVKNNLFDYTEEELLTDQCLTHYQVLNVAVHATPDQIKKAYRKCSLKYHPDKTGRGDDDYVFLAVKAAYDTLLDPVKRQGYDSTVLPFDDSIPASRSALLQDAMLLYSDDDFFDTFGPVFARNLRFDARLRPDLKKGTTGNNGGNTKSKGNNHRNSKNSEPPSIGDVSTPLDQVNAFYEYWIHFESWRDFSAQAADELQVENELENAESRYEKRWIQKEIDRRARQLKRTEMARLQSLVERAMEADPRLRLHRQALLAAKEEAAAERERAKHAERFKALAAREKATADEAALKEQKAAEKLVREQEKKLLRKARQALRKMASESYESYLPTVNNSLGGDSDCGQPQPLWNDSYDMQQDVEFLCINLSLEELNQLNEDFEMTGLPLVHQLTLERKMAEQDRNEKAIHKSTGSGAKGKSIVAVAPWSAMELSALAKAVKKFPAGGASRWDAITHLINASCRPEIPRTREACIEKYNLIARCKGSSSVPSAGNLNGVVSTSPPGGITPSLQGVVVASGTTTNGHADISENVAPVSDLGVDGWTPEEDKLLQDALSKYPASMEKNERWAAIATSVPGQTKKACVQRFKAIREALLQSKTKK